jgi:hypothetical protein
VSSEIHIERRKRRRPRLIAPSRVTLVENQAAFDYLLERLAEECPPKSVQQEGDLLALAQLRWRMERLDLIHNQTLNWQLMNAALPTEQLSNEERLMFAQKFAAEDDSFVETQRQHLAVIKTMHTIGGRVEKWRPAPKGVQ